MARIAKSCPIILKEAPSSSAFRMPCNECVIGINWAALRKGFGSVCTGNNGPVRNHTEPRAHTTAEPFCTASCNAAARSPIEIAMMTESKKTANEEPKLGFHGAPNNTPATK